MSLGTNFFFSYNLNIHKYYLKRPHISLMIIFENTMFSISGLTIHIGFYIINQLLQLVPYVTLFRT